MAFSRQIRPNSVHALKRCHTCPPKTIMGPVKTIRHQKGYGTLANAQANCLLSPELSISYSLIPNPVFITLPKHEGRQLAYAATDAP